MPRAVIFDVDGTLVDSNDAHAHAWVEAAAERGFSITFEEVRSLIGMGGDKVLPLLTGLSEEDPEGHELKEHRGEVFRERWLPKVKAFPGVRELALRLQEAGIKLVVASSASEEDLSELLERAGVADLVESSTSSDDAEESKPDPDIVQAALARCGCAPHEAVMVGDTPYDVEACQRAGVPIVGVRCGGWSAEALAGAVAVYEDPADLLAHFEASPLVNGAPG